MGERSEVVRYAYWSDRRIRSIAADNDIELERRLRWTLRGGLGLFKVPLVPEYEIAREARDLRHSEIASKIERAIGDHAVEDFVTPPPVKFAKGVGQVVFAHFVGVPGRTDPVVMHTVAVSSTGERVDVCLFASMDNVAGYVGGSDKTGSGWVSSAAPAVFAYLASRCEVNMSQWDDLESIAMEALKIAKHQGCTESDEIHAGKPWTRGFTFAHAEDSEWYAEIYRDVRLTKDRWHLDEPIDRILIGAPLWIRTARMNSVVRYRDLRKRAMNKITR